MARAPKRSDGTSRPKGGSRSRSGSKAAGGRGGSTGARKKKVAGGGTRAKKATAAASGPAADGLVRLNKLLADNGVASRRAADELIAAGKVSVDGERTTTLGLRVDPDQHVVEVNGEILRSAKGQRRTYYLLNKPSGVVCTNERRETRPRAVDLITDRNKGRIYTVGRLDEQSKGLLLLTNDGDFANRVMHPRYGVSKTYMVKLRGRAEDDDLNAIRDGVYLSGKKTQGVRILIRKRSRDTTHLMVVLHEGVNREIRRMFARVGFKVMDLKRARIGHLTDRGLKIGSWRPLTRVEVEELLAISDGAPEPEPRSSRGSMGRAGRGRGPRGGRRG
jgi:23S rRNA pseudouridine2605 synthase